LVHHLPGPLLLGSLIPFSLKSLYPLRPRVDPLFLVFLVFMFASGLITLWVFNSAFPGRHSIMLCARHIFLIGARPNIGQDRLLLRVREFDLTFRLVVGIIWQYEGDGSLKGKMLVFVLLHC
jgi:hypothetical protein